MERGVTRQSAGAGSLLGNSVFLVSSTILGSLLGFVFWLLVARRLPPHELGVAAALVSAIALLAMLGDMGIGLTLVRYLAGSGESQPGFTNAGALTLAATTSAVAMISIPFLSASSPELREIIDSAAFAAILTLSAVSFAVGQLLDKVFVSLESAYLVFVRTAISNVVRLGLILVPPIGSQTLGAVTAVGAGALVSVALLSIFWLPRRMTNYSIRRRPLWHLVLSRTGYSLGNHVSQLAWSAPAVAYPLLVVNVLDAESNAYFYTSWMLANALFVIPTASSTAAFAKVASGAIGLRSYWKTMRTSIAVLVPLALLLAACADVVLWAFGPEYVENARAVVAVLAISAIPYAYTSFLITRLRLQRAPRAVMTASLMVASLAATLVVALAARFGLLGIGYGWILGQSTGGIAIAAWYWFNRGRLPD